jgi:hypothetical protein
MRTRARPADVDISNRADPHVDPILLTFEHTEVM